MQKTVKYCITAIIILVALAALIIIVYSSVKEKYEPSTQVRSLTDYYAVADNEAMMIFDETVDERTAYWQDGQPYLALDLVKERYIHRFFWSEAENLMIYTTPTEIIHFVPGNKVYTVNGEEKNSEFAYVCLYGGQPYIAMKYLEECAGMTYTAYSNPNRVMITYSEDAYLCSDAIEATQIRVSQDIKADVLSEVKAGDCLRYIDGGGIRENGFIKVMSADGVRGYILEECLSESYYKDPEFTEFEWPRYTHLLYAGKIYMAWHLLYTENSVSLLEDAVKDADALNVVAPTWFFLTGTEGDMTSYANAEYSARAHELGLKVWGTFKNDTIADSFNCTEDSHTVLSSADVRARMIENIMKYTVEYGLDGVNIDYEMLKVESGIYFIQFLRELSVACRRAGIVLSVDNYIPANYNAYYDLAEQAKIVDYVVIMGYDEHTLGSGEAGSVSSLGWFTEASDNTLEKVPKEQIIMGVPFYTRLWKEVYDGGSVKLSVEAAPNMREAEKTVSANKAELTWKDAEGQYYAEYSRDGAKYRIWLEDEASLTEKVKVIRERDFAGLAAWKLTDEKPGIWDVLYRAFEGEIIPEVPEEAEEGEAGKE